MKRINGSWWLACSAWLLGCGGHAVDLDRAPDDTGTADAGATGLSVESLTLDEGISTFYADESRIYWETGSGKLQSCDYEHCAQTELMYVIRTQGPALLTTATDVFFVATPRYSTLVRCPKSGCIGQPTPFVRDEAEAEYWFSIAVDDQYLYWASSFDIYRCPLSGCAELPELVAAHDGLIGTSLLLEGDRVYYSGSLQDSTYPVRSAPKDGSGPPTTVATTPDADFAVDATRVYWIDGDFHIQSCAITGCDDRGPTALVTGGGAKQSLRVDAQGIYWLDSTSPLGENDVYEGTVLFCPLTGCSATVEPEAVSLNTVSQYQLTSKYVYWIEPNVDPAISIRDIYRTLKPTAPP